MRHSLVLAAALFLIAPPGSAQAAGEGDILREDGTLRYRFYTELEFLMIDRGHTPDVEVTFNIGGGGLNGEEMDTDDVQGNDWEPAGRGVLGFRFNEKQSVEGVFMGWGHGKSATRRSPVAENLFAFEFPEATAFPDESFDEAAVHDLEYDSTFYSGEINYRHGMEVDGADYRFNLLAGIRAIRLEENLGLTSWDTINLGVPPPASQIGTYDIATRNTMIGAQLGVETLVPLVDDRLDFNLYLVGGGYANQANVYIDYFDGSSGAQIRQSRNEWDAAGVFETAAHFKVRLWRGIQMKLGYRAVYLLNVASAPDQFSRSGSAGDFFGNSYDNDGTAIFHGPSMGLAVDF